MTIEPGGGVRWRLYAEAVRMWIPIIVSVSAISLTIFQAVQSRRHTRLSVQPRTDWRISHDDATDELRITMVNVGFGPAVVTAVELHHGEEAIGEAGFDACARMDALLGRAGGGWDTACFAMSGEFVLRPGDEEVLYASRPGPEVAAAQRDAPIDYAKIDVRIRYCSFYEDCWWNVDR